MVDEDGSPKYADYEDYIINHEREPGIGPLAGFRGNGENQVAVNPILGRLKHTRPMEHFGIKIYQRKADTIKWRIWHTKNLPLTWVSMTHLSPTLQIYSETLQKFHLARRSRRHSTTRTFAAPHKNLLYPFTYGMRRLRAKQFLTRNTPYTPSLSGQWQCDHSWGSKTLAETESMVTTQCLFLKGLQMIMVSGWRLDLGDIPPWQNTCSCSDNGGPE